MLLPGMSRAPPSLVWVPYLVQSWNVQGPCHSAQTVVYFRITKEVNLKNKDINHLKTLKLAMTDMLKFFN
jgi:hypothetical protein